MVLWRCAGNWRNMKKIIKMFILALWFTFLRIRKVLAAILIFWLVSFLVGIFLSPKLMELVWCIGIFGMSLFLFLPRCKQTVGDIYIIRKGNRYNGICLGMTRPYRSASSLFVEWTDSDNMKHKRSFNATDNKSKYPHNVNVYSYNNKPKYTNLGWRTLIKDFGYVLTFLPFVILSVVMLCLLISDMIKHGIM